MKKVWDKFLSKVCDKLYEPELVIVTKDPSSTRKSTFEEIFATTEDISVSEAFKAIHKL